MDTHNNSILNNKYKILFYHNKFPDDNEKIQRRIIRFNEILQKSENKVIFIRKTHLQHHHTELKNFFSSNEIINEIEEAEKLDILLQTKYPKLDFQIIFILSCNLCYCNPHLDLTSKSKNIQIENISNETNDKNFEQKYCDVIKKIKIQYSN
jgi:hypothetical protein